MQADSLYRVEPPNKERSSMVVGRELISLYRKEFSFTTKKLCRLFDCDRSWIEDFVRPNVQHLLITYFFRKYILEQFGDSLDEKEYNDFSGSFYFYSSKSLERFWRETAVAKQKTTLIDLSDYLDPGASITLLKEERSRHINAKKSRAEKERHLRIMELLLTPKGFSLYLDSKTGKAPWQPVPLPKLPLERSEPALLTTSRVMKQHGLKTDGAAYKFLLSAGAVHIKLGWKTYWYVPEHSGEWLISVPIDRTL